MPNDSSFRKAAQLLTTLSLRPDLATRVPDLHFGLQRDYQRWVDLQQRRRELTRQLQACDAGAARLRSSFQQQVVAARFALNSPSSPARAHDLALRAA